MKLLCCVVALIALLGLLVYTNPSMDDFGNYVRQTVMVEAQKELKDPVGHFLGSVIGGIAGGLVASQTVRTDYLLFSTYQLQFGKERIKALGIFRNFVLLEKPDFERLRKRDAAPE